MTQQGARLYRRLPFRTLYRDHTARNILTNLFFFVFPLYLLLLSLLLSDLVKMSFETSSDHGGYCFDSATFITTNFFDQKAWDVTMVCELLSAHNVLASTVALCEQVMSLH